VRIVCPCCGERGVEEFSFGGDASVVRPEDSDVGAFADYVYLRENPQGPHREYWHHAAGCRAWLVVTRDTRTHEIAGVALARDGVLPSDREAAP
jgi:methylglutamate dehydrogenase subunit B